jgi:hypothetical protein
MAVYKVIQDVEAEDKLVGPFSLKAFVYLGVALVLSYIDLRLVMSGIPIVVKLPLFIVLFLPAILFGTLASPLGRDQPTEFWLLAHIRYLLKPRTRIWSQTGLSHLVTITAPKKLDTNLLKTFTQDEAQSRLKALANTLDSRGWAVKNVNINLNVNPDYLSTLNYQSDRLVTPDTLEENIADHDVSASDDILDESANPTAQKFENLIEKATAERKKTLGKLMSAARHYSPSSSAPADEGPSSEEVNTVLMGPTIVAPQKTVKSKKKPPTLDEELNEEEKQRQATLDSLLGQQHPKFSQRKDKVNDPSKPQPEAKAVTSEAQADKLELAQSGNDLSVASIASLANRKKEADTGSNEVTVSLH